MTMTKKECWDDDHGVQQTGDKTVRDMRLYTRDNEGDGKQGETIRTQVAHKDRADRNTSEIETCCVPNLIFLSLHLHEVHCIYSALTKTVHEVLQSRVCLKHTL